MRNQLAITTAMSSTGSASANGLVGSIGRSRSAMAAKIQPINTVDAQCPDRASAPEYADEPVEKRTEAPRLAQLLVTC